MARSFKAIPCLSFKSSSFCVTIGITDITGIHFVYVVSIQVKTMMKKIRET